MAPCVKKTGTLVICHVVPPCGRLSSVPTFGFRTACIVSSCPESTEASGVEEVLFVSVRVLWSEKASASVLQVDFPVRP